MKYNKIMYRSWIKPVFLLAIGSVIFTFPVAAENITLRYNQWFPTGHWSQSGDLYKWFDQIKKVTDGRVLIEPSAKPFAPPNRNYQAVVDGVADIAWGPHGYTPGVFPLSEMVELPFITKDAGISSKAYWRVWDKYFKATGMQNEVITLAMHVTAGGNIHMREKPILRLSDLNGMKMRVPTPVIARMLQKVGSVPVSGSLGELREMLSKGIVDGTMISDELVTGFKLDKNINAITQIPGDIFSNSAFVIMNKGKWEMISAKDQAAIMAISGEGLSQTMGGLWQKNDLAARKLFKQRLGKNYILASDKFIAELKTIFASEQLNWLETTKKAGIDGKAAVEFYNAQIIELSK